jgi:hypothetical protein
VARSLFKLTLSLDVEPTSKTADGLTPRREHALYVGLQTVRETVNDLILTFYAVQFISTEDLQVHSEPVTFVPKIFTDDRKKRQLEVCQDLQGRTEEEPDFTNSIITGDETWVFGYDPETKVRPSQRKDNFSPTTDGKALKCPSKVKTTVLMIFSDSSGIVHCEFTPPRQPVNEEIYK